MPVGDQPERPQLRSFTVDDECLAQARPRLSADEFALADVTDEEWIAFHVAIADGVTVGLSHAPCAARREHHHRRGAGR